MKTVILIIVLFTTPVLFAQDISITEDFDVAITLDDDLISELATNQPDTYKKSSKERGVDISFYPNPTQRYLTIESSEPIDLIRIYNASGKEVMRSQLKDNKLSVADLDVGFYLISVQSKGLIIKKKIIKKVK